MVMVAVMVVSVCTWGNPCFLDCAVAAAHWAIITIRVFVIVTHGVFGIDLYVLSLSQSFALVVGPHARRDAFQHATPG